MSPPTKPKIKLIIKRNNSGTLNASSYPTSNSEKEPSPQPIEPITSELKLPAKPTLQRAQELLRRFGEDPIPLIYDVKKQEAIPGSARMTVLKSRRRYGKSAACLGPYAIGRSMSEKVALKRLQANREAARVAARAEKTAKQTTDQPVAWTGAFFSNTCSRMLLKEYELCMAMTMAVVGDVAQSKESTTMATKAITPVDTPIRKTPKRKAATAAGPGIANSSEKSSAKRRKR